MNERIFVNELPDGDALYPNGKLLGVLPDLDQVNRLIDALNPPDSEATQIEVFTGLEGIRLLDSTGDRNGWLGRWIRSWQGATDEKANVERYVEEMKQGRFVVVIKIESTSTEIERIAQLFECFKGYFLNYYGFLVTEPIHHIGGDPYIP